MGKMILHPSVLRSVLKNLEVAANQKTLIPVLENVRIERIGDKIKFRSSSTHMNIETCIEYKIDGEDMCFLCPYTKLVSLSNALTYDIEFSVSKNTLSIKSGSESFKLKIDDFKDYPSPPAIKSDKCIQVTADDLKLIKLASISVKDDLLKPAYNNVFMEISESSKIITCTDANTMFVCGDIKKEHTSNVMLPVGFIRALKDVHDDLDISYDSRHIQATCKNTTISHVLTEGKYPDYKSVIPIGEPTITLSKNDLNYAVQRVCAIGTQKGMLAIIELTISEDKITIRMNDSDLGVEAESSIPITNNNPDYKPVFRLNTNFLLRLFRQMELAEDDVELLVPANSYGVIFSGSGQIGLIMAYR